MVEVRGSRVAVYPGCDSAAVNWSTLPKINDRCSDPHRIFFWIMYVVLMVLGLVSIALSSVFAARLDKDSPQVFRTAWIIFQLCLQMQDTLLYYFFVTVPSLFEIIFTYLIELLIQYHLFTPSRELQEAQV